MKASDLPCRRDDIPIPETFHRTPNRPLGALSDFIAEELPRSLENLSNTRIDELCEEAGKRLIFPNTSRRNPYCSNPFLNPSSYKSYCAFERANRPTGKKTLRLALLDLAMLERALLRANRTVPVTLSSLMDKCASPLECGSGLMYEGIIHANPLQTDPRVFSAGELGQAELFFYEVHDRIERHLARAVQAIRACIPRIPESPRRGPIAPTHDAISAIQDGFRSLHEGLDPSEFAEFRDCFSNAHLKRPGPSALFSAGMYSLDHLLAGEATGIRQLNTFKHNQSTMFPTTIAKEDGFCGYEDMKDAKHTSKDYDGLLFHADYPLHERLELAKKMAHAREMHLRVTKQFLPEGFNEEGTGDAESLRDFLQIGIDSYTGIAKILPLLSSLTPPKAHAH